MSDSTPIQEQSSDPSNLISTLLSSPESLSKINEIIEKHTSSINRDDSPLSSDHSDISSKSADNINKNDINSDNSSTTSQNQASQESNQNPLGIFSFLSSKKFESLAFKDEQITLLLAIRPYLSEHRKELIDTFIKMNRLGSIFKNLT